MPNFTKGFQTDDGYFELSFSKIESFTINKYFVRVHKASEFIVGFDMKQNTEGEWEVIAPAPAYIMQAKDKLARLIEDYCNKTAVYFLFSFLAV